MTKSSVFFSLPGLDVVANQFGVAVASGIAEAAQDSNVGGVYQPAATDPVSLEVARKHSQAAGEFAEMLSPLSSRLEAVNSEINNLRAGIEQTASESTQALNS